MLKGLNFSPDVIVAAVKRLVREPQIVLLSSVNSKSLISNAALGLQVVEVGSKFAVACKLGFRASNQVALLGILDVASTVLLVVFVSAEAVFVTGMKQSGVGLLKSLGGSAQVELSGVGNFGEFRSSLLCLVEIVVRGLQSVVAVSVLTLLKGVQIS